MMNCRRLSIPINSSFRCLSAKPNYKITQKSCFYEQQQVERTKVHIPFQERYENMNLERRWYLTLIEKIFEENSTIIAFHMNYIHTTNYETRIDFSLMDKLEGMSGSADYFPRHCFNHFLRNSKYKHMIPLFQSTTGVAYTNNPEEVSTLCKELLATQPQRHIILGGMFEGKLCGPATFVEIGQMEDMKTEQAKLVGLLSQSGMGLTQALSYPQNMLAMVLDKHSKSEDSSE